MTSSALYLHSAQRGGRASWPWADPTHDDFLGFGADASIRTQVDAILRSLDGRPRVVCAHSIRAVPAVLAAASSRIDIAALVLVEPALYDLVRGDGLVERHISAVTEARAQAADGNLRGCWAILRPLMLGGAFDPERWDAERVLAGRWARSNVPWGHGIRVDMLTGVPTLVVTGGWNEEYELIARTLVAHGGRHRVVAGAQHRPQDMPGFAECVDEFLGAVTR